MPSVSRTGEPSEAAAEAADPKDFGRYRLLHRLASGGMGSVYLARASGPGGFEKLVALKRVHEHLASDPRFATMFLDEARIAARIQHPNVCGVIDFGQLNGAYYLTMPYIFGEPLHRVVAAAVKRRDEVGAQLRLMAVRLVADACEGLHAAHELKDETGALLEVVHRDVSPHNLMVGYDGVVRVLDFGVASARHRQYQTSTGEVKGKFAYASPEQIEGRRDIDRRSDIWSLGVVLWEAVTGKRLFARDNMLATVRAVADGPIPPITAVWPSAPAGLAAILDRALARDPARRYASARAMGRDLQQLLAAQAVFVTSADVAEWMTELFPDGLGSQEQLVELTRTGDDLADAETSGLVRSPAGVAVSPGGAAPSSLDAEDATDPGGGPARPGPRPRVVLGLGLAALTFAVASVSAVAVVWIVGPHAGDDGDEASEPARASADEASPAPAAPIAPSEGSSEAATGASDEAVAPLEAAAPPAVAAPVAAPDEPIAAPIEAAGAPVDRAPEASRRDRARAPGPPGTLTIATPGGWGIVFLDGRRLGETPGVFTVPSGSHVVHIQPFGRGPRQRRSVVVPAGGTARLSVPLAP